MPAKTVLVMPFVEDISWNTTSALRHRPSEVLSGAPRTDCKMYGMPSNIPVTSHDMCQFSDPDNDYNETSLIAQATALHAEQLPDHRAAGKASSTVHYEVSPRSAPTGISTFNCHCVRGWWRETL